MMFTKLILRQYPGISGSTACGFHTCQTLRAGGQWRYSQKLPRNHNRYGPLTNAPDYSFADGRLAPPGNNVIKRYKQHKEYAEKIITMSKEVDFAIERHARIQKEEAERREHVLTRKLKPKAPSIHYQQPFIELMSDR